LILFDIKMILLKKTGNILYEIVVFFNGDLHIQNDLNKYHIPV